MLGKSSEVPPQTGDSFYDDGDDDNSTSHPTPIISSIRIVTSKPPVYRQQSQSSSSLSPSSDCSDHDVTDVSSLGGDHPPAQREEHNNHSRKQDHDQRHPFHLHSMRHVLLGSSVPTSRPPSPADAQERLIKKHVRIVTDESDKTLSHPSQNRHHQQQPYIHGHTKDFRRVRLTSSAINRQKQQQKIERENLRILERLQHTRATHGLKRDELLTHYDRQMGFVTYPTPPPPPAAAAASAASRFHLPSRPASATMMSATFSTSEKKSKNPSRPSSASHALNSSHTRSRPGSAPTSLHGSSRSTSSARKTTWNDRWQQHE